MQPNDENRYAWEHAWRILDTFIQEVNSPFLHRAWVLAQRYIEAHASGYRPDLSPELALAYAWEDFEMACRGRGHPGIAGAFFLLWSRCPSNWDHRFEATLRRAFDEALLATDPRILRYPAGLRKEVATLKKGYDRGEAAPNDDHRWHGVTPQQLPTWLEEAHPELQPDRPGLIVLQGGRAGEPHKPKIIRRPPTT